VECSQESDCAATDAGRVSLRWTASRNARERRVETWWGWRSERAVVVVERLLAERLPRDRHEKREFAELHTRASRGRTSARYDGVDACEPAAREDLACAALVAGCDCRDARPSGSGTGSTAAQQTRESEEPVELVALERMLGKAGSCASVRPARIGRSTGCRCEARAAPVAREWTSLRWACVPDAFYCVGWVEAPTMVPEPTLERRSHRRRSARDCVWLSDLEDSRMGAKHEGERVSLVVRSRISR
jgi:hypothetical protein